MSKIKFPENNEPHYHRKKKSFRANRRRETRAIKQKRMNIAKADIGADYKYYIHDSIRIFQRKKETIPAHIDYSRRLVTLPTGELAFVNSEPRYVPERIVTRHILIGEKQVTPHLKHFSTSRRKGICKRLSNKKIRRVSSDNEIPSAPSGYKRFHDISWNVW